MDFCKQVKPLEDGKYAADTFTTARILVTGVASIAEVEVGVLDSDTGSADFMKRYGGLFSAVCIRHHCQASFLANNFTCSIVLTS